MRKAFCLPSIISLEKGAEPMQIVGNNNQFSGIIYDVVQKCAAKHYHINNVKLPLERFRQFFSQRLPTRWVHMGAKEWSDDSDKWIFSEIPILRANYSMVSSNKLPIHSIEECRGKRVIFIYGIRFNGFEKVIKGLSMDIVYVSNHQEGLLALDKERAPVFIEMDNRIRYALKQMGKSADSYHFVSATGHVPEYDIYLSFGPTFTPAELSRFNSCLLELQQSGELTAIIQSYQ